LREDYSGELDTIVKFSRESVGLYDADVVENFERSLRPFLMDHPVSLRDPLGLLHVPSDVWLLGWGIALCLVWKRNRMLAGILVTPVLATYVMSASLPVGNARYAYPLIPHTMESSLAEYLVACVSARMSRRLQSVGR
jgi:hypothetical protein